MDEGLPKQRFQDLRHSCAWFLLARGGQARVVMECQGRSLISLTMNTYAHAMPWPQAGRSGADEGRPKATS